MVAQHLPLIGAPSSEEPSAIVQITHLVKFVASERWINCPSSPSNQHPSVGDDRPLRRIFDGQKTYRTAIKLIRSEDHAANGREG